MSGSPTPQEAGEGFRRPSTSFQGPDRSETVEIRTPKAVSKNATTSSSSSSSAAAGEAASVRNYSKNSLILYINKYLPDIVKIPSSEETLFLKRVDMVNGQAVPMINKPEDSEGPPRPLHEICLENTTTHGWYSNIMLVHHQISLSQLLGVLIDEDPPQERINGHMHWLKKNLKMHKKKSGKTVEQTPPPPPPSGSSSSSSSGGKKRLASNSEGTTKKRMRLDQEARARLFQEMVRRCPDMSIPVEELTDIFPADRLLSTRDLLPPQLSVLKIKQILQMFGCTTITLQSIAKRM